MQKLKLDVYMLQYEEKGTRHSMKVVMKNEIIVKNNKYFLRQLFFLLMLSYHNDFPHLNCSVIIHLFQF